MTKSYDKQLIWELMEQLTQKLSQKLHHHQCQPHPELSSQLPAILHQSRLQSSRDSSSPAPCLPQVTKPPIAFLLQQLLRKLLHKPPGVDMHADDADAATLIFLVQKQCNGGGSLMHVQLLSLLPRVWSCHNVLLDAS